MSLSLRSSLPVIAAAALLAGCGALDLLGLGQEEPAPLAGAPIRTDSAVYHLRTGDHAHELTIGLSYTNATGSDVYIPTCHAPHPPVLQKWEEGAWVTAYAPPVLLCLGPPVVIEEGTEYGYSYRVVAAHRPDSYPRFEVAEIPGTYRLVWHLLGTWSPDGPEPGLGTALPLEHRVSNTFQIVR